MTTHALCESSVRADSSGGTRYLHSHRTERSRNVSMTVIAFYLLVCLSPEMERLAEELGRDLAEIHKIVIESEPQDSKLGTEPAMQEKAEEE